MQRKLASIQMVQSIEPIVNADAIELVHIQGWQCVTKKGEFAPGDLGVFLEIDAIPPDEDRFRFLWTPKTATDSAPVTRPDKFRIRTMRLRGALSQGLFLPVPVFPELGGGVSAGEDVTEALGVAKYEPPPPTGMGDWRASFPALLPKTDEMRVQSVPEVLEEMRGLPYVATLKYDGTSATFLVDPFRNAEFHVCSRNQSIRDGGNLYWDMARKYDIETILRANPRYAVQAEIVGPGIQKNPLGLKEVSLFVFNIYDMERARYLNHGDAQAFLAEVRLPAVETVERGDRFDHTLTSLLSLAEGRYAGTGNEREGIVVRPLTETHSAVLGGRLSFKVISNAFLLKEKD